MSIWKCGLLIQPVFSFSHDAMDSYYEYIWDVTILEYLTCILVLEYS